ncbi:hypothetical protein [Parasphingorhabdus sp.]|jgi:hypothetical protein|nr:hypothetical protein [Sphingomonadales bacterium]
MIIINQKQPSPDTPKNNDHSRNDDKPFFHSFDLKQIVLAIGNAYGFNVT